MEQSSSAKRSGKQCSPAPHGVAGQSDVPGDDCVSQANARLTARIRDSFAASDRTYGSRRVWRDLQDWGEACSENRVARLMRVAQLKARSKRRRLLSDSGQRPEPRIAANILARQLEAAEPNQRWVADFTYVWTVEGWLYVAVVLDL